MLCKKTDREGCGLLMCSLRCSFLKCRPFAELVCETCLHQMAVVLVLKQGNRRVAAWSWGCKESNRFCYLWRDVS